MDTVAPLDRSNDCLIALTHASVTASARYRLAPGAETHERTSPRASPADAGTVTRTGILPETPVAGDS